MPKASILIVEDETDILDLLAHTITTAGFEALTCKDGIEALDFVSRRIPNLVLLDLMLPELDGLEVCRELKRSPRTTNIPVIILTARSDEIDRIVGLELGAEDYISKPFSPRELVLRIKAVLRRCAVDPQQSGRIFRLEGLAVDLEAHKASVDGEEIELTATEFKLFSELIRTQGKVLTRQQLLQCVWGYQYDGYARTVDTHVRRLRQKLGPYSDCIETARGVGYRFREKLE